MVKVEREYDRSAKATRSLPIQEHWFYGPTFLKDDKGQEPSDECSLFVYRFRLYVTPKGKLSVRRFGDVERFPTEDAMVAAIEERGLVELPYEQPPEDWMPDAIREVVDHPTDCGR